MWFLWFCSVIFLIIIFFYLAYLRGKSLQYTWDSIFSVVKQKNERIDSLHKLGESDIDSISIEYPQGKYIEIKEQSRIREFKNILKESKICKIKYSYIPEDTKIKVQAKDKEVMLNAFVLSTEKMDAFLELMPAYPKFVICLPGLKKLLDGNI